MIPERDIGYAGVLLGLVWQVTEYADISFSLRVIAF
jgi:hypothetical protein